MAEKVPGKVIAAEWGVEPITVRRWRQRGLIPFLKIGPRVVRYDPQAVREALQSLSTRDGYSVNASASGKEAPIAQAPIGSEAER